MILWCNQYSKSLNRYRIVDRNFLSSPYIHCNKLTQAMKRITRIIILALAALSFGSCISVDDLNPMNTPNPSTGIPSSTTANCYIVSNSGSYSFPTVKGGSTESVGNVVSAEVLWESFGTDVRPSVGDLIGSVSYSNGEISYTVSSPFKEGNAVIAAKDAYGEILWSWHIWLTDQPEEQVYYNNAGTMMDRNLGATSATPGDVGALGLLYQWGRKDPFLGSSSINSDAKAKSTGSWPLPVALSSSMGTVDYATKNPMTFIDASSSGVGWLYSSRNDALWQSAKTIYDPCPAGWRVPDGGFEDGVWYRACGFSDYLESLYDDVDKGVNFSGVFGSASVIWYPGPGQINSLSLSFVGEYSFYWSVTPFDEHMLGLDLRNDYCDTRGAEFRCYLGNPVRCLKE